MKVNIKTEKIQKIAFVDEPVITLTLDPREAQILTVICGCLGQPHIKELVSRSAHLKSISPLTDVDYELPANIYFALVEQLGLEYNS